jgi:hypothetical protein
MIKMTEAIGHEKPCLLVLTGDVDFILSVQDMQYKNSIVQITLCTFYFQRGIT